MHKNFIAVNTQRCKKCSLCVQDCPRSALDSNPDGIPVMTAPENCVVCGHCAAICPFAALSLNGSNPDELPLPGKTPEFDELKTLLQMRRSHRRFQMKNVDPGVIAEMLDSLRYVPTGNNFRRLHYTLIDDIKMMSEFREYVHTELLNWSNRVAEVPARLQSTIKEIRAGKDPIFRTAPHLLVASYHQDAPTGLVDSVIALSQFEMLAQSRNLGTLWFGRILTVMNLALPEIPEILQIPSEYKIGYAMLFGETQCRYHRGIDAPPVDCRVLGKLG